ncbi:MAG: LPS export ABC transporter periplasmic protein LptC [Bacteroidia bacterium]|nr:LPS export ABC transporter periplasmic protein LptC [Bacteroidia bacterium]
MRYLLTIYTLFCLIACNSDKEELRKSLPLRTEDSVAVESFGVRFLFSDSAKVTAELYASHVMEVQNSLDFKDGKQDALFKKNIAKAVDHILSTDRGAEDFTALVMQEAMRLMPKPKEKPKEELDEGGEDEDKDKKKTINSPVTPNKPKTLQYMEDSVHIDFLDRFGRPHSFIESKSGIYNQDDEWAVLIEDVILKNEKGERLETIQLFWDKEIDSVYTHTPVKITTPDKIITGSGGMRSTTSFDSYVIFGTYGEVSLNAAEEKKEAPKPKPTLKPTLKPAAIK